MVRLTTVCTRLTMGVLSIVAVLANEALDPGPFSKREPVDRPSGPDVRALEPGLPVERQLTRGEEHRYQLALATGEYASVTIDQQGIGSTS